MIYILPLVGILAGVLAIFFGVGGGVIIIPMLLLTGMTSVRATGSSSFAITLIALSILVAKREQLKPYIKLASILVLPAMFGSWLGASATAYVSEQFHLMSLIAVMVVSLFVISLSKPPSKDADIRFDMMTVLKFVIVAKFVGFLSGFFGIGGGFLLVPALMYFGLKFSTSALLSVFVIFVSNLASSTTHFSLGNVAILESVLLGVGGLVGRSLGDRFLISVDPVLRKRLFMGFMMIAIILVLVRS